MTAWAHGPSVRKLFVELDMCKSRRWVEAATALRNYSRAAMTSAIDGHSTPKTLMNASAGAPSSSVLVLLGRLMRNESPRFEALPLSYVFSRALRRSASPVPCQQWPSAWQRHLRSTVLYIWAPQIRDLPKSSRIASRHEKAPPGTTGAEFACSTAIPTGRITAKLTAQSRLG